MAFDANLRHWNPFLFHANHFRIIHLVLKYEMLAFWKILGK